MLTRRAAILGFATLLVTPAQAADPGISADKIVFGQVAALQGPAAALGEGMRDGILSAFAEANARGGVKGRKLQLVSKDDGYEPNKAIEATKQNLGEGNVFALIGPVGTRERLLAVLSNEELDFGGARMTFGADDNQRLDEVYLTMIQKDRSIRPVTSLSAGHS